ncbi:MAG: alpha/beta hydrolase [Gemmatimonadota bacterium]|nr:MAG: alpha/beta hydrolase [Gemmatimonadota bacterium]
MGTLDEFDPFCTFLASGASCAVVSVDYRLAPEYKHPAAVEDAVTVVRWIFENAENIQGDPARIAIAGDSAGGNLAAVSSILARDQSFSSLIFQVLICPWLNLSSFATESYHYFGDGLWLSAANMKWYRNHYLQNKGQAMSPSVSPILADDLGGLPPAFVITAEFDVLRDEGEAYAHRLREKGIPVLCTRYEGMLHDFVILPGIFDRAQDAIDEICQALQVAFRKY